MRSNLTIARAYRIRPILAATFGLALAFTFSCSSGDDGGGGGGGQNSQLYDKDGTTPRNISGTIRLKGTSINIGSVKNGAVNIDLPATMPSDYLSSFIYKGHETACSYPADMKVFIAIDEDEMFQLISGNELLGRLTFRHSDEQIYETIFYLYSSIAGKITCYLLDDGTESNIDLNIKERWNNIYVHRDKNTEPRQAKWSTNNIVTKELRWKFHPLD